MLMSTETEAYAIEIGRSEMPDDIVTTRVRSADRSLGLTCPRVNGPSMAAQLMGELAERCQLPRGAETRLYRPWPVQPERYRVAIKPHDVGTIRVTVEAEVGRAGEMTAPARDRNIYRTAAQLMQRLRREAGDPAGDEGAVWRASMSQMPTPPRLEERPAAERKGGGWPDDEELPLDPDECVALVKGMGVVPRRPISLDQLYQLPGSWEMSGGRIWFYRT